MIGDIRAAMAASLLESSVSGNELEKPGWVRLNLSALMSDEKINRIIEAVDSLTKQVGLYQSHYRVDRRTAQFEFVSSIDDPDRSGVTG